VEASQRGTAISLKNSYNSYTTISNLNLEASQVDNLWVSGGTVGVVASGLTVENSFENGIYFYRTTSGVISSCLAAYNGSDGITFAETPSLLIDGCTVHDNDQLSNDNYTGGIHGGTDTAGQSTNVVIEYNDVYNNGLGQPVYRGAGITMDTMGTGAIIQYNDVHDNYEDGIGIDGFNGATVEYNVVYNNGIGSSGGVGYGIFAQADQNTSLTNTTVIGNTVSGNQNGGIIFAGPSPEQSDGCSNNTAENNISVGTVSGQNFLANGGCENAGGYGRGNTYTHNAFGAAASNFLGWGNGTYYSTYAAWEAATGNCGTPGCSHFVQADPQFVNAAASEFWLASGSPAIDAGLNLGSPYNIGLMPGSTWPNSVATGDQNAYGSGWEIGAFVYVPVRPSPPS
jgi:hypothetical protein